MLPFYPVEQPSSAVSQIDSFDELFADDEPMDDDMARADENGAIMSGDSEVGLSDFHFDECLFSESRDKVDHDYFHQTLERFAGTIQTNKLGEAGGIVACEIDGFQGNETHFSENHSASHTSNEFNTTFLPSDGDLRKLYEEKMLRLQTCMKISQASRYMLLQANTTFVASIRSLNKNDEETKSNSSM